jgi:LacI family transcriptional regulator
MSSSRITIKDIARHLGVHHATVSRALRGDVRISASMRQLVTDYAQKQGYAVNQNALNLRNMSRNEIALVVPNISHYTFSYFIGKMSDLANNAGYVVSVFQSKERAEIEKQIIDTLIKNRVAGVIASISKSTLDGIAFQKLIDFGIPLVFFDRVCSDVEVPTVTTDNFSAALTGVRYLFQKGYRRIAHITGPAHVNVFRDRQLGYRHGLRECGLDYSGEIVFAQEFHLTDGQKALDQLLANATKPDAVFCDSFVLSAGVVGRCKALSISIPADLAVLSIANDPFSALIDPPQTILEQPLDAIGQSAFDLLIKAIDTKVIRSNEHCTHPIRLIERKSV